MLVQNKLKYLEGLRGIAAIIVVFHHYTLAFFPAFNYGLINQIHFGAGKFEVFVAQTPLNLFCNGGFAVCLFFILSGYVLSQSYYQNQNPNILSNYAIKRYVRLFIPVSLTILISYLFIKTGLMHNGGIDDITKSGDWLSGSFNKDDGLYDLIKNIFINVFINRDNKYNPVLWTMTYELLGSFLLFSFLLIIHPIKKNFILYVILIFVLFFTQYYFYSAFILGAFLNKYKINYSFFNSKWFLISLLIVGLFFGSYPLGNDIDHTFYRYITFSFIGNYDFYHVIGAFFTLFVVLKSLRLQKILSTKFLNHIGKISFSFYLIHFIILCSLSCYLFKVFYPTFGYNKSVGLAFISSLPVIIIISIYYYKYVDKFGIKFSEKILGLFNSKN